MNWFTLHLASGLSLFSGTALVCVGVLLAVFTKGRLSRLGRGLAATLGTLLIILSSSPFPYWVYALVVVAAAGWSCLELVEPSRWRRSRLLFRLGFPASCLLLSVLELPHHLMPPLPEGKYDRMFVIGDSLSAGIDDNIPTWPAVLAERRRIRVVNLAKPGASLSSAKRQAAQIPGGNQLVLLEIGGNDLLGSPTPMAFEQDLGQLLQAVCGRERVVFMLELPLLPLQSRYGQIQRTLAANQSLLLFLGRTQPELK